MQRALEVLKENWGYDGFRGIQEQIIESVMNGHDTLGLMPTGGGKSITFQVPTLCMEGLCVVVTPLVALMKDQVVNLRRRNILAAAVHSGMSRQEISDAMDNCAFGRTKFLYISPERIDTELFQKRLHLMRVSLICVDEAHCISQWGYDFRPAYLEVKRLRELLPDVPVLALTATATPRVVDDICKQLEFKPGSQVFRMSFERANLAYIVEECVDKYENLLALVRGVTEGSVIVYTRSREGTREIAQHLTEDGVPALDFHAGMLSLDKDMRQKRWLAGDYRVIVATNAFGMGIDKPDVRLVVHMDLPDSIEAYFQEAGRAGRDGQPARAVLLYQSSDATRMRRRVAVEFPPKEFCLQIYDEVAYFLQVPVEEGAGRGYEFNLAQFCRNFRHYPVVVESALRLLTRAGYFDYRNEDNNSSRLVMCVRRDDLYYVKGMSPLDDRVLNAVLRLYAGVFADFVFINEEEIAYEAELTHQQVYDVLLGLSRMKILTYIPRNSLPHITYLRDRLPSKRMTLPREVYDERRDLYIERIEAMLGYATATECRSRYLLAYFGEKSSHNCGVCDVCQG